MTGTMDAIKGYFRSHHDVSRALLACIVWKTTTVQNHCDYLKYVTSDGEMIPMMLHLPPDMNKLLLEHNVYLVKECMAEYEKDNKTVYDTLGQICKDTTLYPYVKQHKGWQRSMLCHPLRLLGPNHVSETASEAGSIANVDIQWRKEDMKLGKVFILMCQVHIIHENLKEY